ncbi:TetR/AcrR family transcriptional regulator [Streptomyces profundus]|uniref:TetR/AcrR family transcriptional regulator n=1 Tax=Streptomyces profundus TaxID=2867410 RepID=UPI001D162915|nr:TetR family transcriptional regulator [Streptomyces sp. MA3_2.13]
MAEVADAGKRGAEAQGPAAVDGRRARGERRRAEIIEATLRVVRRDGAAGVTHRSVAREAGVPTSLTTYHFASIDDLLVAALTTVADDYTRELRAIIDGPGDPLDGLAAFIAAGATERTRCFAERELSTLAARRPALRPAARDWRELVAEIGRSQSEDPVAVEAMVAAADGLCASILLGGTEPDLDLIRTVLAHTLGVRKAPGARRPTGG